MSDKMGEVEAAKKAVLAVHSDAFSAKVENREMWMIQRKSLQPLGPGITGWIYGSEGNAWVEASRRISAASKLAPLTEDAPKCKVCTHALHEGACGSATDCLCVQYPSLRGVKVTYAPTEDAPKSSPLDRDWPEDASHENGQYFGRCVTCGGTFIGHKRRVECKVCATASPVGELDGAFEYVEMQKPPKRIRAVKWTGNNLDEVRKVYPGLGEEYMRDKGCNVGDYVISPYKGRVYFQMPESFEDTYESAALSSKPAPVSLGDAQTYGSPCCNSLTAEHHPNCTEGKPAPEGIPERPQWGKLGAGVEALLSTLEAIIAKEKYRAKEAEDELASLKLAYGLSLELHGCGGNDCTEEAYVKDANEMMQELSRLNDLKLSSAKVREETLREAAGVFNNRVSEICREHGSYDESTNSTELPDHIEDAVQDLETARDMVLSLLPTSPESQEGE